MKFSLESKKTPRSLKVSTHLISYRSILIDAGGLTLLLVLAQLISRRLHSGPENKKNDQNSLSQYNCDKNKKQIYHSIDNEKSFLMVYNTWYMSLFYWLVESLKQPIEIEFFEHFANIAIQTSFFYLNYVF
jgi:hypothetical protein